jgi:hypothetical protein
MQEHAKHWADLLADRPRGRVHVIRGKDSTGKTAVYAVYMNPRQAKAFWKAMKEENATELLDYGAVIARNYGTELSAASKKILREQGYDWSTFRSAKTPECFEEGHP